MIGTIENLRASYGFIRGSDGVSYFFIPSGLQTMQQFAFNDLQIGYRVEFTRIDHPRGPRAIEVLVTDGDTSANAHNQDSRVVPPPYGSDADF